MVSSSGVVRASWFLSLHSWSWWKRWSWWFMIPSLFESIRLVSSIKPLVVGFPNSSLMPFILWSWLWSNTRNESFGSIHEMFSLMPSPVMSKYTWESVRFMVDMYPSWLVSSTSGSALVMFIGMRGSLWHCCFFVSCVVSWVVSYVSMVWDMSLVMMFMPRSPAS